MRRVHFAEIGLLLVIVGLGALLTLAAEPVTLPDGRTVNNFLRLDNLVPNVATTMSWIAVMAVGATVVIAGGGIDISVGSIFGLAALVTAAALQQMDPHAPAWRVVLVAILAPLATGLLCGLVNGALVIALRVHPFIITLGTLSIFRGLALVSVPAKSLPSGDRTLPDAFTAGFVQRTWHLSRTDLPDLMLQPVPMIVMLIVGALGWLLLNHMVWGRETLAVGGNEEAARFAGIPVARVKLRMYAISGLSAGIAGMISAGFYGSASTATGEGYELTVIAAAVVGGASLAGGRGTALGALCGALIIKLIENGIFVVKRVNLGFASFPLSKEYSKIIIGAAIILAVAADRLGAALSERRRPRGATGDERRPAT